MLSKEEKIYDALFRLASNAFFSTHQDCGSDFSEECKDCKSFYGCKAINDYQNAVKEETK